MDTIPPTERTRVRRRAERGAYDRETINRILDEGLVGHVGFIVAGQPYVLPLTYARHGEVLYLHGSAASRMLRTLAEGIPVCVTVTLLDGLVLARSARRHSMNYRSVVILGTATPVVDPREQLTALEAIVNHAVPGRWSEVRPPTERELKETAVLRIPITEASAKIRTGPPLDDEADLDRTCWAGVIPLRLDSHAPVPDPRLRPGIDPPAGGRGLQRNAGAAKSNRIW
jgi:hypothetical protein